MNNTAFKTILLIVLIAIAGLLILNFSMKDNGEPVDTNPIATTTNNGGTNNGTGTTTPSLKPFAQKCGFKVTSIRPEQTITFPIIISGIVDANESKKAECYWSRFEGQVGAAQIFANVNNTGFKAVGDMTAMPASDWMATTTTFRTTLNLKNGVTLPVGTPILIKFEDDNARGAEFGQKMDLPLTYGGITPGTNGETMQISAYFHDMSKINEDCSASFKITRTIPKTLAVADASLRFLFSEDLTELEPFYNGVTIKDKVARIDFKSGALQYLDSPACMQATFKGPIEKTLLQYPTINRVEYSIDGKVKTDWDA